MKKFEAPDELNWEITQLLRDAASEEYELGETELYIDTEISINDVDYKITGKAYGYKVYDSGDWDLPSEEYFTVLDTYIDVAVLDWDGNEIGFCEIDGRDFLGDLML